MITLEQIKSLGKGDIVTYEGDEALKKVKKYGYTLRYVKEQTPEICLEAVKQDGDALRYVNPKIFKQTVTLELTDTQLEQIKKLLKGN